MNTNKVTPKEGKKSSQHSVSTQQNFLSVNELSSIHQLDKSPTTISNIRKKYLMQILINRLKFLIAPLVPSPHIKQNWSEQAKNYVNDDQQGTLRQTLISQISYKHKFWPFFNIIEAICAIFLFWAASTELVFLPTFRNQSVEYLFAFELKSTACVFIIFKLILGEVLIHKQRIKIMEIKEAQQQQMEQKNQTSDQHCIYNQEYIQSGKDLLKIVLYGGSCVFYLIIHFLGDFGFRTYSEIIIVLILMIKMLNLKPNMEKIYNYVESKDYKNQFRIVLLFFLVFGVCHIIALVLYSMTYMYPDQNWINQVNKPAAQQNTWFSHYVCSIYFTITTMATVGYGDITPVQTGQIFIVSFIQLFGSALFGYMINVVGISVAEINKKNQQFDNHVSTINKLQNHYQISRQLHQKFKNEIIKNQSVKKQTPLSENQETEFFKMMQNSLKQEFILQTNIKVIKKSIFFLTHFTVNFQNEIALRLIRKIYKKNETISLVQAEQDNYDRCMLIINSGSVDIEISHQSNNIQIRKFIKNISPREGKPTLNVFGYSALILNKNIDLVATTKDTSVIYLLRRKDVLECMDRNMLDFEGISQLRERMIQYKNVNYIEAPSMIDIQKHFIPNIFIVNKKKKTIVQQRQTTYKRNDRKSMIKVITLKNYQYRTMICIDLEQEQQKQGNLYSEYYERQNERDQHDVSVKLSEDGMNIEDRKSTIVEKLDQIKNYENFMKKSNFNTVIHKYHEYLRKLKKSKKMNEEKKRKMEINKAKQRNSSRNLTFTQGLSQRKENAE